MLAVTHNNAMIKKLRIYRTHISEYEYMRMGPSRDSMPRTELNQERILEE